MLLPIVAPSPRPRAVGTGATSDHVSHVGVGDAPVVGVEDGGTGVLVTPPVGVGVQPLGRVKLSRSPVVTGPPEPLHTYWVNSPVPLCTPTVAEVLPCVTVP